MKESAVIIGGGLGGLFCGAILAKEGLDVTVIEKNSIIGGGLQSFSRFGVLFDTGMHIIGGVQKDGNIRRICEYLGIWDKVHIKDADPDNIDTIYFSEDRKFYHIAQGRNRYVDKLCESFPGEREHLEAYVEAMYKVADEVDLFYLRPSSGDMQIHSEDFHISANSFIAKYIKDEHLQSIVAHLNPLYGGLRDTTPAYIHSLISVLYIDGSSRFAGGSILFARTLSDYIQDNGGRVIAGDGVALIHSRGKLVTGVTTMSGNIYTADYYISAIHPCSMFELLEDEHLLPKTYRSRLNELPNSYSAFTLNIKLKKNTFKFFNYTMYYMSRYDAIWNFGQTDTWPCGFLYITPPEINQGEYAGKIIVTAPMPWNYVKKWSGTTVGNRGEEYEQWKSRCREKLLDCMEEIYPDFRSKIEAINSASPLTIRDFYGVKEGSMCGFSKDCNNIVLSQVPVVTKVPNLLLTGQNCNLHGFCGVTLTAINTCEAILGRNFIIDKIDKFRDIRPYLEYEIPAAIKRIASNPLFDKVQAYLYPGIDINSARSRVARIDSVREFQKEVMYPAIETLIHKSCTSFSCQGLEHLSKKSTYLYVSNHRDIALDASLLSYSLNKGGFDTPEITFGANLMEGDFVIDIGKVNKMFKVERPGGDKREFYRQSEHLSDYIRTTLTQRGQSVWIAQRNGRTKDGIDRTDHGIVKMFAMSGRRDKVKSISELNITPVSISYEWESCDILKALELYKRSLGPYHKSKGEDLNSILTGFVQPKGKVHITVCDTFTEEDLKPYADMRPNAFLKSVAELIDRRICSSYRLWPNNWAAYDIRSGSNRYSDRYTPEQKYALEQHIDSAIQGYEDRSALRSILLDIYANPVDSKHLFTSR